MLHSPLMIGRREALLGLGAVALSPAGVALAAGQDASAWSSSTHSAVRLISGGGQNGRYTAGIAFRLKPGFKTYWRHPGDSGVPPVFRFEGSGNLASAEVHFPAPRRFDDGAGGVSFGYLDPELILPVTIAAADPAKPVRLRLQADYAVCEKLCVPAAGAAELDFSASGNGAYAEAIRKAMAMTPRKAALGKGGPLQVAGLGKGEESEQFFVAVRNAGPERPELFIEGEPPWFLDVKAFSSATSSAPARFTVQVVERDRAPDCTGADLTLTLVSGAEAIESRVRLDIGLITP
ncbi:MAG: cytochrome C biogenesis protein [Methylocystis sp.]|nr:cytochrome C biogenesis protein [Methylocystis sp.]MCA3583663.1 cytochrome C biogenesis protein [Methylocystis sp.]MCA3587863.1 cytochrome C biogenesis protein [Methylocystis sp.]MCA3593145.1 cytochrome C biogenesis protein [Methylocystis sp.]